MEVKPLKSYKEPGYPDKLIVLNDPNILKLLPQRWKGNVKAGIALSSVIMLMLSGCGQKTGGSAGMTTVTGGEGSTSFKEAINLDMVAPIFKYGSGRGSFGCVSVAPPAFLSEAEAFEIISEELKREGIVLDKTGLTLEDVDMPLTSLVYISEDDDPIKLEFQKDSLELDGYDPAKKIGYEFVSKDDIVEWQNKNQGIMSSVESYDAIGTAEALREGLEGRTAGNTAVVFYDPMGFEEEVNDKYQEEFGKISENGELSEDERNNKWSEINQNYENELREIKENLLREQVKGFLEWLKAQGVI